MTWRPSGTTTWVTLRPRPGQQRLWLHKQTSKVRDRASPLTASRSLAVSKPEVLKSQHPGQLVVAIVDMPGALCYFCKSGTDDLSIDEAHHDAAHALV